MISQLLSRSAISQKVKGDQYTVFLLQSDTWNGSQTFVDYSKNNISPLDYLGVIHSTAQVHDGFGSSTLYFDGVDDYLLFPDHPDFDFSSVDFTVDYWAYFPETITLYSGPIGQFSVTSGFTPWTITRFDAVLYKFIMANSTSTAWMVNQTFGTFTTGAWIHFAMVRNGADVYVYIDGTRVLSVDIGSSTQTNNPTNPLSIGARYDPPYQTDRFCKCYLDEIRISRGIARWTGATFSVPTGQYT